MLLILLSILGSIGVAQSQDTELLKCDEGCVSDIKGLLEVYRKGYSPSNWEKVNDRLGDRVALGLRIVFTDSELKDPANISEYLVIIEAAFEFPRLIIGDVAKEPNFTLELLEELKETTSVESDIGRKVRRLFEKLRRKPEVHVSQKPYPGNLKAAISGDVDQKRTSRLAETVRYYMTVKGVEYEVERDDFNLVEVGQNVLLMPTSGTIWARIVEFKIPTSTIQPASGRAKP